MASASHIAYRTLAMKHITSSDSVCTIVVAFGNVTVKNNKLLDGFTSFKRNLYKSTPSTYSTVLQWCTHRGSHKRVFQHKLMKPTFTVSVKCILCILKDNCVCILPLILDLSLILFDRSSDIDNKPATGNPLRLFNAIHTHSTFHT